MGRRHRAADDHDGQGDDPDDGRGGHVDGG